MKSRASLKWSILAGGTAGIVFSAVAIYFLPFNPLPHSSYSDALIEPASPPAFGSFGERVNVLMSQANPGLPIRLAIPKINVDAPVTHVGFAPDGAMGAPVGPTDVAWFELGPRPGANGSAIITGHYGRWKSGEGSVFDSLRTLEKGDKVLVEDEEGVTTIFVVREIRKYDPEADAAEVFGASDAKAHLNLITCEGEWNAAKKTFSERLVVFTDREE